MGRPEEAQARPGVEAGPLAGGPQAEGQPAQRQGPELPILQPDVQKQVHQQDEEHRVHVDGGDAGLDVVHEIGGEEQGPQTGDGPAAEEPLEEDVQGRQHQHPEEGAGKAPAEGGHAEEPDAQADDLLAQGRVGGLVGLHVVQMLPGGAGVVNFVKVAGIEEGAARRDRVLLVHQLGHAALDRDGLPVAVQQHHLAQPGLAVGAADAHVAGMLQPGAALQLRPLEGGDVVVGEGGDGSVVLPVLGPVHVVAAVARPRVDQGAAGEGPLGQGELHGPAGHGHEGLGRGVHAQAEEGRQRVEQRNEQDGEQIPAAEPAGPVLPGGALQAAPVDPRQLAAPRMGQVHEEQQQQQRRQDRQQIGHQV